MKKHITTVELSAYADGEARNPDRLGKHISDCRTCQASLAQIKKLSHSLKNIPTPDVHPAFASRVMATFEERSAVRRSKTMPWGISFAGVAAMGLLVAAAFIPSLTNSEKAPKQLALENNTNVSPVIELRDEATLLAEFDRVFAEDDNAFTNVLIKAYTADPIPDELDAEFVVMALANNEVLDSVMSEWAISSDVRSVVNSLNESETSLFKQLLAESARSELTSTTSIKG